LEKEEDEKEEQKNDENINNINNSNSNNQSQNPKKKKKKKNKKKNFKLTEEELNQIYSSFYNENNNFSNQNKTFKNKINPIQITSSSSEKSAILHNLILSFEKNITKKISSLHEIKYNSILLLCQKIKNHFKSGISVTIYGSYSTGLELEESDIDISVEFIPNSNGKFYNNINLKTKSELINELNEYLSNFPEFKNLFPIPNTQIPILKMKILSENNIETKIDLTFNLNNTKNTINFYNSTLKKYRQIKPLTLLIKNLIKKNKLASVFDGGFSSHSIFIMVTANVRVLLKNKSSLNLGDLLNGFLHFYGKVFNYTNTAIDLMDKHNPYIITQEFANVPVFVDPITKTNVSKSSYLHQQLKKLFSDTYDRLVQGEDNLNKTFEDIFF
jgi:DNA polymerase sigma